MMDVTTKQLSHSLCSERQYYFGPYIFDNRWRGRLVLVDVSFYIEWINNKLLFYSPDNYIQYPMINHNIKYENHHKKRT